MMAKAKTKAKALEADAVRAAEGNCIISAGTAIQGDLQCRENIRLDGKLEGDLRGEQRLVLGPNGVIAGNVTAGTAIISGHIQGNLEVSGLLQLTATARVDGEVSASRLEVEAGAACNGTFKIAS